MDNPTYAEIVSNRKKPTGTTNTFQSLPSVTEEILVEQEDGELAVDHGPPQLREDPKEEGTVMPFITVLVEDIPLPPGPPPDPLPPSGFPVEEDGELAVDLGPPQLRGDPNGEGSA